MKLLNFGAATGGAAGASGKLAEGSGFDWGFDGEAVGSERPGSGGKSKGLSARLFKALDSASFQSGIMGISANGSSESSEPSSIRNELGIAGGVAAGVAT